MKGLIEDCRHAVRLYARTPGATVLAIATLAIAMAFVSAFLSLYDRLTLNPESGLADSSRIVTLDQIVGGESWSLPSLLIEPVSDEMTTLDAAAGVAAREYSSRDSGPIIVELVTRDFFGGLRPLLHSGRGFEPAEHVADGAPVAVISYRYWQEAFGGIAGVLGTSIWLNVPSASTGELLVGVDTEFRVVGVMSPEMTGMAADRVGAWLALERTAHLGRFGSLYTFGRRADGASLNAVRSELEARYLDQERYGLESGARFAVENGVVRDVVAHRETKRQLRLFLVTSALLAFVAAANVSLFLLARAPLRRRELGIRLAIGARLSRLLRQLVTEAALLVLAGTVLGVGLSIWLSQVLRGLAFLRNAEWRNDAILDWRVLAAIGAMLVILTLLVSLAPMLGLRRSGVTTATREVSARANPLQHLAGSVQIVVAGALGGAAIAFIWHLSALMFGDPGYETADRYQVEYSIDVDFSAEGGFERYRAIQAAQLVELPRRRAAIEAIPGVTSVAFGGPVPGQAFLPWTRVVSPDNPADTIVVDSGVIERAFVDSLGLTLLSGRLPTDGESDAALVNQAFANMYFGREDIVGESVALASTLGSPRVEIVGVLEDLSFVHPLARTRPRLFRAQDQVVSSTLLIESTLTAALLRQELERVAAAGELEVSVRSVTPLAQLRRNQLAPDRARGLLTTISAVLVVSLAGLGFYGIQRYLVAAGRREYAVRASVGAGPGALGRLVYRRGLTLGLAGLILGGFLAFIAVAWLRDEYLSREVSPGIVTFAVLSGLTLLLIAASFGPAREARRTQPAPLLRVD